MVERIFHSCLIRANSILRSSWIERVLQRYRSFALRFDGNKLRYSPPCYKAGRSTTIGGICTRKPLGLLACPIQRVISVNHGDVNAAVLPKKIFSMVHWSWMAVLFARCPMIIFRIVEPPCCSCGRIESNRIELLPIDNCQSFCYSRIYIYAIIYV